jgi:phenylacetate-coenzyme A ligase PaaK-like adenylate-forming protein
MQPYDANEQPFEPYTGDGVEDVHTYFDDREDAGTPIAPQFVDPHIWMDEGWDRMDPDDREKYLVEMVRQTLERAESQPIYAESEAFQEADPDAIDTLPDILNEYPVLTKDGEHGFRQDVAENPETMLPQEYAGFVGAEEDDDGDERPGFTVWESGGTGGVPTPTYLSGLDMEVDASGLVRAFKGGDLNGTTINGYNSSHKGGRAIFRAMQLLNGEALPMRPEEDADDVVRKMKRYDADGLAAVETGEGIDEKSGGKNFFGLMNKDWDAVMDVDTWFVTGYPLIDDLIDLAEEYDHNLFTTYGTSEAIPLGSSTRYGDDIPANFNTQHLNMGPHIVQTAVEEDGELRPAEEGERGVALVTTIDRRHGTIYVNYAIGDALTLESYNPDDSELTTPLVSDIEKQDNPLDRIEGGCTVV